MDAPELKKRIARLKREKKEEEERRKLRGMEREAISEAREAKRERRISGLGLAVEKAKVYKALPLPHVRPRDAEEAVRRAEQRAERAEAEAATQIALSRRRTEVTKTRAEAAKAEAEQKAEERAAKRARLLEERALRTEFPRAGRKAVVGTARVAGRVGVGVGKVGVGLGKGAARGIRKLGEMGEEYGRKHPRTEPVVDLGLGRPGGAPERKETFKEPPLDLSIKIE